MIETTDREAVRHMLRLNQYIDVLIPGGAGLINMVVEESTVPVLQTGVGNCHVYVDAEANLEMAVKLSLIPRCSVRGLQRCRNPSGTQCRCRKVSSRGSQGT